MICREKYVDLCVLSPRGKVVKALIDSRQNELNKYGGYTVLARVCWGITFENWPSSKIVSNRQYYALDQWLESILFQEASRIS